MASSVSRELGSVAKTVADTSVSKPYRNKKGGSKGPPSISIVTDLLAAFRMLKSKPTPHRPNENATHRERLDNTDTSAAYDANGRSAK
jgi:hypothetical protein